MLADPPHAELVEAAKELERPRVGRTVRREGKVALTSSNNASANGYDEAAKSSKKGSEVHDPFQQSSGNEILEECPIWTNLTAT